MKKSTIKILVAGILLAVIAVVGMAARTNYDTGATLSRSTVLCTNLTVDTALTATTAATIGTANITTANVATALVNSGTDIRPSTGASLTSPAVTVSAAGATVLSITTDAAQTGLIITGGTQWQVLIVRGTDDTNTIQATDGTASMTLTGNAALGLDDSLTLLGTSADGDEWMEIARALN